jgi:hypothetical protein
MDFDADELGTGASTTRQASSVQKVFSRYALTCSYERV